MFPDTRDGLLRVLQGCGWQGNLCVLRRRSAVPDSAPDSETGQEASGGDYVDPTTASEDWSD
jgi:hypothetical protein